MNERPKKSLPDDNRFKSMLFLPENRKCLFSGSPSVLEVAIANEISLSHSCGGMASCTTCLIHVRKGLETVGPRNELETEHAVARNFEPFERLACQTLAADGMVIFVPGVPVKAGP